MVVRGVNMAILQILIVCGIISGIMCQVSGPKDPPSVEIDGHRFVGKLNDTFAVSVPGNNGLGSAHVYYGIPYAEPPVGSLRFKKPVPIESYSKDYKLINQPPACPQYTDQPVPAYPNSTNYNEDCLYLNIWAPPYNESAGDKKRAVMYWIYGGGHRYGSIDHPFYDGVWLASKEDIVVVTVNYRVGFFGFLTSNLPDAPGNVGLWDVLEGLKWVNKYIDVFGGDPENVTIAGESAGAVTVGYLTISPLAKGLYHQQIMMASSPVRRRTNDIAQNLALSQQLAKSVGCANDSYTIDANPEEVVECLRGVDADKIAKADHQLAPKTGFNLVPQFGDEFLPEDPRVSIINGDFTCTDLFIGSVQDAGSYRMTANEYRDYFGFFGEKDPHVDRDLAEEIIRKNINNFPNPDEIVNYYLPDDLTDDSDYAIRKQAYTALGDVEYMCPAMYYAEKCAEQNKKVYFYNFNHRPTYSPWASWMGTTLFDDVPYVFAIQHINNDPVKKYYTDDRFGKTVSEIFSRFVKKGEPVASWPLYSKDEPNYWFLNESVYNLKEIGNGPNSKNCEFLRPHFGF